MEIFICCTDMEVTHPVDRHSLQELLRLARDHSWGASLYLVVNRGVPLRDVLLAEEDEGQQSRELWLMTAIDGKVLDILEIDYPRSTEPRPVKGSSDVSGAGFPGPGTLRSAADEACRRHELLRNRFASASRWRCILHADERDLKTFLARWVEYSGPVVDPGLPEHASGLLIVVNDRRPEIQKATVTRALGRFRKGHRFLVATLTPSTPELAECCARHGLPPPVRLFGAFQLWYFLLRLNRGGSSATTAQAAMDAEALAGRSDSRVRSVDLQEPAVFRLPGGTHDAHEPDIVVTSAFNSAEPSFCLDAAKDVGALLRLCPLELRVLVEPSVTLNRLFQVIDRWKSWNVWVHLGHGEASTGLYDGMGESQSPESWLRCFRERDLWLELAMFLTCQSTSAARLFAEAGVGVAIGFESAVESDKCRELAVDVLEAALAQGVCQEAILAGFRRGCHRLEVQEDKTSPSEPFAFYPRHR
jgi:hypothetical protein